MQGALQKLANNSPQVMQLKQLQEMATKGLRAKHTAQLQAMSNHAAPYQQKAMFNRANSTGLPERLKTGMERLSGLSLDDVNVYRNSDKPAQLQAHAYAQGSNIYLAPGQEKHLPHEAWHVVQQKQGRVKATMQIKGATGVNDSRGLELEADIMGAKATSAGYSIPQMDAATPSATTQRLIRPGMAVAQRVYLHDSSGTRYIPPSTLTPLGYIRTGMHDDGVHGLDHLYQQSSLLDASGNAFFSQHGFGNAPVTDDIIRPDEQVLESSQEKIDEHYRSRIIARQDASTTEFDNDVDSSDSESEAGFNPRHQVRRRQFKASMLAAISETMHPLSASDEQFRERLSTRRRLDNANTGKRQMYPRVTREMFAQIGEQFKRTSFRHNPYYRRAFRRAVPKAKVKTGGSDAYTQAQSKIRTELQKEIAQDFLKMDWRRADFPSDQIWNDVQFMQKNVLSNASTGDTYHDRVESAQDTSGSEARIGFHHIAWKEAEKGKFAPYALNPANLTGLNDTRDILNPKKLANIKSSGGKPPKVGAHDAFGHQGAGYKASDKTAFSRAKGGGQFKDIDLEATDQILEPLLDARRNKRKLYRVDETASSSTLPIKEVVNLATAVRNTAQHLISAMPNPHYAGGDPNTLSYHFLVQQVAGAAGLVDTTNAANVAILTAMHGRLHALFHHFQNLVHRHTPVWVPAGNALGAQGERIPALEQFFAECGQMAAHNALVMAEFPDLANPPALLDETRLNPLGPLADNITEGQIRTIINAAGRNDIPVFGNIQQMGTIIQLMRQGNYQTLAQYNIGAQEQWGAYYLSRFMDRLSNTLVIVVNTDTHKDATAQGRHWVTIRLTRQMDGQIAIRYLDSLVAPANYTALFQTLRAFLHHVPAQAVPSQGQN